VSQYSAIVVLTSAIVCSAFVITPAAQTPLRFEVASIRPSASQPSGTVGLRITPGQARFSFLSLKDYITIAYGVRAYQIAGPDWLAAVRFEIVAKIPEGQQPNQVPAMMRALLEDRFKLRTHRESREFAIYSLEIAPRGPALVPVPDEQQPQAAFAVESGPSAEGKKVTSLGGGATLALGDNRFEADKVTMTMLADTLARFVDRPVVNMTNLEGRYDIAFSLAPEDFQAMMTRSTIGGGFAVPPEMLHRLEAASTAAIPDALEKVGLLLRSRHAPIDVLVIDRVERIPTEN
jgi:uncharacterized protein (TIGR03435 family)